VPYYSEGWLAPCVLKARLAHGVAAIAAVVAEITVAGSTRDQVVTVVALMAQIAKG
jgi:hypothetical protein